MSGHSHWPGVVRNHSSRPVWVLWDEGDDDNKEWFGRPLASGRRSPKGLDIDGVCAYLEGMKIADLTYFGGNVNRAISDWWWLGQGAEVKIEDRGPIQTIYRTSTIGSLSIVADSKVSEWAPSWELDVDLNWGEKL